MKTKITIFGIILVGLLYFAIFVAGFLPFIAEHKQEFEIHLIGDYALNVLLHPINNSIEMINAANPLFYICMGAALFLFIYLLYKTRTKEYENVGERYGVQGTSRWAKKKEIFGVPEQIEIVDADNMLMHLQESVENGVNE